MEENKTRTLSVRISAADHAALLALIKKTQSETNLKVTQAEMIAKLIRDASR